jgi:molybdate transport system substrate-binding protein
MRNCVVTAAGISITTKQGLTSGLYAARQPDIVPDSDIPIDCTSVGIAGTALPLVAFHHTTARFARAFAANAHGSATMHRLTRTLFTLSILLGSACSPALAQDKSLTVFAAASMKNALDDIDAAYTAKSGVKIVASYAASSALAKQIEQGAPADVFVSADTDWMDYATAKKTINEPTRVNLLGNSIVLIAPKDSRIDNVAIGPSFDLSKLAGDGKIATGDVKAVPSGKYAKAALEKLGAWSAAELKFAMTENVRAALTLVARGEAVLGIVYATDAKVERGVKIVGTFPADSHPAIIYPVAATASAKPEARDYLSFLRSSVAKAIFEKYGFSFLVSPTT